MRGARGKDSGERVLEVAARVHFEHVAVRTMEPGDDDELVSRGDPGEPSREGWIDVEPGVRRSFRALPRRLAWRSQGGADVADRVKRGVFGRLGHGLAKVYPEISGEIAGPLATASG